MSRWTSGSPYKGRGYCVISETDWRRVMAGCWLGLFCRWTGTVCSGDALSGSWVAWDTWGEPGPGECTPWRKVFLVRRIRRNRGRTRRCRCSSLYNQWDLRSRRRRTAEGWGTRSRSRTLVTSGSGRRFWEWHLRPGRSRPTDSVLRRGIRAVPFLWALAYRSR